MHSRQKPNDMPLDGDFANAWRAHREDSRSLHEMILYPTIIHALSPLKPLFCLLDAGCGTGGLTCVAMEALKPKNVMATDLDGALVKEALARCGDTLVGFTHDLTQGLPVLSGSVDGLICSNVLMHLSVREAYEFVRDVGRVLTEEGRAVFAVTHPEWAVRHYAAAGSTFPFAVTRLWGTTSVEHTYLDASGYRTLFAGCGLDIVERIELTVPDIEGLSVKYAASIGMPIFDVYCLKRARPFR